MHAYLTEVQKKKKWGRTLATCLIFKYKIISNFPKKKMNNLTDLKKFRYWMKLIVWFQHMQIQTQLQLCLLLTKL